MEEVTEAPTKKQRLAVLPEGNAGDGGPGTAAKPLIDHGTGAPGEKHGQCEEEVQLRVRVEIYSTQLNSSTVDSKNLILLFIINR